MSPAQTIASGHSSLKVHPHALYHFYYFVDSFIWPFADPSMFVVCQLQASDGGRGRIPYNVDHNYAKQTHVSLVGPRACVVFTEARD